MIDAASEPPTTLTDAADRFVKFLRKYCYPAKVRWIFRDDVVADSRGGLWVRHNGDAVVRDAGRIYEEGLRKNLGIALHAVCIAGEEILAIVHVPSDEIDSQYSLMGPGRLKLSAVSSIARAEAVRKPLRWWLLKTLNRKHTKLWNDAFEVPSR